MTVAYDAVSSNASFGDPSTYTHTPVGTPRGIIVTSHGHGTGGPTTVTYGGTAMTLVRLLDAKGTGENTMCAVWHLGASIPTGAQTVSLGGNGGVLGSVCVSLTGAADTEVQDDLEYESDSTDNPTGTLVLGGNDSFCLLAFRSGEDSAASVSPGTGWTQRFEDDIGTQISGVYTYNTIGSTNVDVSNSMSQTADDLSAIAVAVTEVSSGVIRFDGTNRGILTGVARGVA